MPSHIYQVSNADELKQKIRFITNKPIPEPSLIQLSPGRYNINLKLPPFLKIKGSGINLTVLNLTDTLYLESNNYLEDLTLEYTHENNILLDRKFPELFHLNCLAYLEQMESADNLIYDNTVYLKNVTVNLYNIECGYIFSIVNGNLELDNVVIEHKIIGDLENNNNEIHNLFTIGNFCHFSLKNCKIDYQSDTDSTFLFSGCLSNIYLNNTHVKLYSNRQLTQSNIFYLAYTKLEIVNSKLENLCYLGNLFFTDTEIDLELSNLLSNFSIDKGTMRIEKIRDEEYFEKLLDYIFGILYQNKKYIFGNCYRLEDYLEIQVSHLDYSIPCNLELVREPEYQPLFLLDIIDSELVISNDSNLEDYLDNYYLLKLKSVTFSNLTQKKLLNFQGGKECNYDFKKGELKVEKIDTDMLSQICLHHVCRQDKGYSMLRKEKVGPESIDFTIGESLVSGAFSFAAGYENLVEGNYSTVLGNNNKVFSSNSLTIGNNLVNKFRECIVLGRYNIPEFDWKQKILVVGNGIEEKKSDALVIYESGEVEIYNSFTSTKISDGIIQIEEGNIKEVKNIEVEGNVYVNQDLHVEGEIKGVRVLENSIPMDIIQMAGERLTTWKLDLSNFTSPSKYGRVLNLLDSKSNYLATLDEKTHGVIYQMEVICIETPNRTDIRFILSNNKSWSGSSNGEHNDEEVIDVISSYKWKKGKRIVEANIFRDEYNYNSLPYYLYLSREVPMRQYQDFGELKMTGKFLVKIKGVEMF